MKLAHSMKVIGLVVGLLTVFAVAAPTFARAHDNDFGRNHYSSYHHYYGGRDFYRNNYSRGYGYSYSGYYYPYYSYRPYYYEPYVSPGFSFVLPGFSLYIAP